MHLAYKPLVTAVVALNCSTAPKGIAGLDCHTALTVSTGLFSHLPLINACYENQHNLSQRTITLDYVHHLEKVSPAACHSSVMVPEKSSTHLIIFLQLKDLSFCSLKEQNKNLTMCLKKKNELPLRMKN